MRIALTLHTSQTAPKRLSLRVGYVPYLQRLGLTPILLPNDVLDVPAYLDALDVQGVVLSGGGDVDPALYGQANTYSDHIAPERDATEFAVLDYALARHLPVLGICRGAQVLNVYFGGGLVQDIANVLGSPLDHYRGTPHPVRIVDQRMAETLGVDTLDVNTYHHQGITPELIGHGLRIFAISAVDGLVEGFYHTRHPILGVQWHPEKEAPARRYDVPLFRRFFRGELFLSGAHNVPHISDTQHP